MKVITAPEEYEIQKNDICVLYLELELLKE